MLKLKLSVILCILIQQILMAHNKPQWEPKKTFVADSSTTINYEVIGSGKQAILFLPGFGLSLYSWDKIKNGFDTTKHTLYFIDLKGFGFSSKNIDTSYSPEDQSKIIIQFLDSQKIHSVTLIGHSYGGLVSLYLQYYISKNKINIHVDKLILIDAPAYEDAKPFFVTALRNPILNFIGLRILTPKINAKTTIRKTFFDSKKGIEEYLGLYSFFYSLKGSYDAMSLIAKQIIPTRINEVVDSYKLIDIPTLIIWGKEDELIDIKYGYKLHNDIKNSVFETVENCGHVPHEEKPIETSKIILNFLNQK